MSMDNGMGAAIGAIGPILAVGLVSKVAQGTMKSVGNSYRSNQRSHRQPSHAAHRRASSSPRKSTSRKGYSIWEGTGF